MKRSAKLIIGLCIITLFGLALNLRAEDIQAVVQPAEKTSADLSGEITELSLFTIPYGFAASTIDIHVYLSIQFWNYEYQSLGKYADQGHTSAGKSNIIPYSGYINLSSQLQEALKVEAEFELYKGGDAVKVCKLRGLWQPHEYLGFAIGRDFGLVGIQERLYYPTSKFKLFTIPPFLHWSVIRYTGWWDTGLFLYSQVPMTLFSPAGKIMLDTSVCNGPGIDASLVKSNAEGYIFENFHSKARQNYDNNYDKPVTLRLSISPWQDFEFGGSYLNAKWDSEDRYSAQYIFSHFLLDWKNIILVAEYGQLKFDSPDDGVVTQFSGYISAGYKLIKDMKYIKCLQPVIRYEHFDSWKEDPTRKGYRESISAGLWYSPFSGWVIKAAYQVTKEPKGPALANNGFAGECVFEF